MQAEKFYNEIQQKIDQINSEPEWDKSEIWQRIEQKQGKRKTPFVWWQAVAATHRHPVSLDEQRLCELR